jgi:hypothetical protein
LIDSTPLPPQSELGKSAAIYTRSKAATGCSYARATAQQGVGRQQQQQDVEGSSIAAEGQQYFIAWYSILKRREALWSNLSYQFIHALD